MDQVKTGSAVPKKSNAQVNIPAKTSPVELERLKREAAAKGMDLSPYVASVLFKYNSVQAEANKAKAELAEAQRKIAALQMAMENEKLRHENEVADWRRKVLLLESESTNKSTGYKNEVDHLKKQLEVLNKQVAVFNDKHLLWLFSQIKGKSKRIDCPYGGTYDFTFNETTDLINAWIYSFKIKKSA